jgi:plasmid maintenance system antidote protein VapI
MSRAGLDWLKKELAAREKTQTGLADALGLQRTAMTHLFKGRRALRSGEIPKIAAYLEMPVAAVRARLQPVADGWQRKPYGR